MPGLSKAGTLSMTCYASQNLWSTESAFLAKQRQGSQPWGSEPLQWHASKSPSVRLCLSKHSKCPHCYPDLSHCHLGSTEQNTNSPCSCDPEPHSNYHVILQRPIQDAQVVVVLSRQLGFCFAAATSRKLRGACGEVWAPPPSPYSRTGNQETPRTEAPRGLELPAPGSEGSALIDWHGS